MAAMTAGASQFAVLDTAALAASPVADGGAGAFAPIRQIDSGPLSIGYVDMGPPSGPPVILLHGWPYDIHSFAEVAPLLVQAGHRVIVPYLRGYGSTVFRSADTMRNAQQSALALDVIDLMDALKLRRVILGGFDWGGRAADIVAALWPERCAGLVSVSGYLIGSQLCQTGAGSSAELCRLVPVPTRDGVAAGWATSATGTTSTS